MLHCFNIVHYFEVNLYRKVYYSIICCVTLLLMYLNSMYLNKNKEIKIDK